MTGARRRGEGTGNIIKAVQKTEKEAEAAFISHQSILLATIVLYLGTIVNI